MAEAERFFSTPSAGDSGAPSTAPGGVAATPLRKKIKKSPHTPGSSKKKTRSRNALLVLFKIVFFNGQRSHRLNWRQKNFPAHVRLQLGR